MHFCFYLLHTEAVVADRGQFVDFHMQIRERKMKELVCEKDVCIRSSVLVIKDNFMKTVCGNQQNKKTWKADSKTQSWTVRLWGCSVCRQLRVHVCQACFHRQLSSRQRFQLGSAAVRLMKANVRSPALWVNTNSIQTVFKQYKSKGPTNCSTWLNDSLQSLS